MKGDIADGEVFSSEIKLHCKLDKEADEPLIATAIKEFTKLTEGGGEDLGEVVMETEVTFLAPNGKFHLSVHAGHIVVSGRAKGAKAPTKWVIPVTSIKAMFLLDNPREKGSKWVLINLDTAIRHGSVQYQYLTLEIDDVLVGAGSGEEGSKEYIEPMSMNLAPLSDTQRSVKSKDGEPLIKEEMEGLMTEIVPKVLKAVSGSAVLNPPSDNEPIAVSNKLGRPGFLFLLKKLILFVPNPAVILRHEQIEKAEFEGVGEYSTVGITFHMKGQPNMTYLGIGKGEVPNIVDYLQLKDIPAEGLEAKKMNMLDSDDDSGSLGSAAEGKYEGLENDSDSDAKKKKKRKREGKEPKEKKSKKSRKE